MPGLNIVDWLNQIVQGRASHCEEAFKFRPASLMYLISTAPHPVRDAIPLTVINLTHQQLRNMLESFWSG